MALYDFPASPVENQEYTPPGSERTYIYKAPRWLVKGVPPIGGTAIPGPEGPAGATGPAGPTGATGATGPAGPAGSTGPKGDKGDTGAASTVPGPAGATGPAGAPGPEGPDGAEGPKGDTGNTGPAGPTGATGPVSTVPGPTGPQGIQGPVGPAGPAGADAVDGTDGVGVPIGGTTGQVLTKIDSTNYNTNWQTPFGPTADTRNRIVNGGMQISQENGITLAGTNAYYPADQWRSAIGGTGFAVDYGQQLISGETPRVRCRVVTPKASLAAADYFVLAQLVEGIRVADFLWGTASAKPVVLRFDVQANVAGTYVVGIHNGAYDRSFLAPFTVLATTWTTVVIPIPGDITGTWATDTGHGLNINFAWAVGTAGLGVAGWQAGNFSGMAGATNGLAVATSHYVRNVGLYLDPLATGLAPRWQMPDEAQELLACLRYWFNAAPLWGSNTAHGFGHVNNSTSVRWHVPSAAVMRAAPAMTGVPVMYTNGAQGPVLSSFSTGVSSQGGVDMVATVTGGVVGVATFVAGSAIPIIYNARM